MCLLVCCGKHRSQIIVLICVQVLLIQIIVLICVQAFNQSVKGKG